MLCAVPHHGSPRLAGWKGLLLSYLLSPLRVLHQLRPGILQYSDSELLATINSRVLIGGLHDTDVPPAHACPGVPEPCNVPLAAVPATSELVQKLQHR